MAFIVFTYEENQILVNADHVLAIIPTGPEMSQIYFDNHTNIEDAADVPNTVVEAFVQRLTRDHPLKSFSSEGRIYVLNVDAISMIVPHWTNHDEVRFIGLKGRNTTQASHKNVLAIPTSITRPLVKALA